MKEPDDLGESTVTSNLGEVMSSKLTKRQIQHVLLDVTNLLKMDCLPFDPTDLKRFGGLISRNIDVHF